MIHEILTQLASVLARGGGFWMPPQVSTVARGVDALFWLIFWIAAFFFTLICVLMVVFAWRFRRRGHDQTGTGPAHNLPLELTWTIVPLILVIIIFSVGFRGYIHMSVPPINAYPILVTGQKWNWMFTYPNGYVDAELHVPVNRPVQLTLTSEDVIHSLYIPAFRVKRDAVPGRYNKAWFQATQPGTYPLLCAEYCGTKHSDMLTRVIVHAPGEFEAWLEKASNFLETMPPAEAGRLLYERRGCAQCHTLDGTRAIGPSFKGLFGHEQPLAGGGLVTVDENYIRESILDPQAKIVAGYDPVMPTYKGRLKDAEITAIIEFIKTLRE